MSGVLIVDDDEFIRKLIATTLEDVARLELHEAADGVEAVEVARREHPRLVFLDVDMPGRNGIEVCRELREHDATSFRSAPSTISAPTAGWRFIWSYSSSVSGPGLFSTPSGTAILPTSCRIPASRTRSTSSSESPSPRAIHSA